MTDVEAVRHLDACSDDALASIADLLDYTAARILYDQLQRRLVEDGVDPNSLQASL